MSPPHPEQAGACRSTRAASWRGGGWRRRISAARCCRGSNPPAPATESVSATCRGAHAGGGQRLRAAPLGPAPPPLRRGGLRLRLSVEGPAPVWETLWGEHDLQGICTDESDTPLQRPAKYQRATKSPI